MNDEDFAEQVVSRGDDGPRGERVSDWGPEREGLAQIADAVYSLQRTLIAVNGTKPPVQKPVPRPETVFQLVRERFAREEYESIQDRLYPAQPPV